MNLPMFLSSLTLTVGVVLLALIYLRDITRRVVRELCASDAGAEFWLRTADVLALSGSLVLVLVFGVRPDVTGWLESLRLSLGFALGGLFVSVMFVASGIWRNVARVQRDEGGSARSAAPTM